MINDKSTNKVQNLRPARKMSVCKSPFTFLSCDVPLLHTDRWVRLHLLAPVLLTSPPACLSASLPLCRSRPLCLSADVGMGSGASASEGTRLERLEGREAEPEPGRGSASKGGSAAALQVK